MQLSGEQPTEHYEVRGGYVVGVTPVPPSSSSVNIPSASIASGVGRASAAEKVTESLRAALTGDGIGTVSAVAAAGSPSASSGPPQKRTYSHHLTISIHLERQ